MDKDITTKLEAEYYEAEKEVERLKKDLDEATKKSSNLRHTCLFLPKKLEIIKNMKIEKKSSTLNQDEFEIYRTLPQVISEINDENKLENNLGFKVIFSIQVAFSSLVKFKNSEGYEAFNVFNKLYCDFVFFKSFKKDCILEPFLILEYHGEGHFQNDAANTNDKVKRELAEKIDIGYYELPYDKYNSFNNKKSSIKEIILDELEKQI